MIKSSVLVGIDLHCDYRDSDFNYRVYVNDELFSERTWIWDGNYYLEENIQIEAPAGEYPIKVTVHGAPSSVLRVENIRVLEGHDVSQLLNNTLTIF